MIARRTVIFLGLSQLICWGISYYLIGAFGERMAADLGWSRSLVYGGFSAALLAMGLSSPLAGRMIDRHGGRHVMAVGSVLNAAGCVGLALSDQVWSYFIAWACLGVAMRFTLYDAAFASLARLGGPSAKAPMSQITLFGGLSSTVFWPIGFGLAEQFGWRGALFVYAAFALLAVPFQLAIPNGRYELKGDVAIGPTHLAASGRDRIIAGSLYALVITLSDVLSTAMSAHMIGMLAALGLAASAAVWVATLRGLGQFSARLCEVLFGARIHPLDLNLAAAIIFPFSFALGLLSGHLLVAAAAFAFFYGAGNGIVTIARGTLPLVLFDHRVYGAFVGRLLVPSFLLSAAAPLVYAFIIERLGDRAALYLSIAIGTVILIAAAALKLKFMKGEQRNES